MLIKRMQATAFVAAALFTAAIAQLHKRAQTADGGEWTCQCPQCRAVCDRLREEGHDKAL